MTVRTFFALAAVAALAACSQPSDDSGNSEDFAARVNGGQAPAGSAQVSAPAADAPAEGKIVEAAPTPGATGRILPADSASCNAPAAQAYLDKPDTPEVRSAIAAASKGASEIRFLPPGSSDKVGGRSDRLNVMIDVTGVIRDLRCG